MLEMVGGIICKHLQAPLNIMLLPFFFPKIRLNIMYACLHFVRIYSASFRVKIQKLAAVSHSNSLWKCVAQNTAVAVCEASLV